MVTSKSESKIVRVNSLQALYDLSKRHVDLEKDWNLIINEIEKEDIPSLKARIRKLKRS